MTVQIEKIHHVAYRCKDAKETVEWYKKNLNMDFITAHFRLGWQFKESQNITISCV
jgi:catechol 2,3-dioxygenase-like lactoylglutathione lyase family enzyme